MLGVVRIGRNFTGTVINGASTYMVESRGPAGAGATIALDSQGYTTCLARNYQDSVALLTADSGATNGTIFETYGALPGIESVNAVQGGADPRDVALQSNTWYVSPSRVEIGLSNSGTIPATVSVHVVCTKKPYSVGSTFVTPATGNGDPLPVAQRLLALANLSGGPGIEGGQTQSIFFPHTSPFKAPGFHELFDICDSATVKLTHGAMKTVHLRMPGGRLRHTVDYPTAVPVIYNSVGHTAIPGYDKFIIVQLHAQPPVAYASGAGAGNVEAGAGCVLVSARWVEKWSVFTDRKGWRSTAFTASGHSVTVAAAGAAGYAVMNQFGTAAANANPPVL